MYVTYVAFRKHSESIRKSSEHHTTNIKNCSDFSEWLKVAQNAKKFIEGKSNVRRNNWIKTSEVVKQRFLWMLLIFIAHFGKSTKTNTLILTQQIYSFTDLLSISKNINNELRNKDRN